MTPPVTTEALVDGGHDMPTDAEIQAMHEEADNFRLPAPPPTPVRGRYYLTECEHCGWVGSSEHCGGNCGPDDDDIVCPVCCSSICGDEPDEADTAKHGEAVYQRIVAAEAERDAALAALQQVTAERDEARADLKAAEDTIDALNVKLRALAPHGSCACSYDRPGDVCEHHSPFLATATSELARLRAEGEAKDRALKLCLAELDWQVSAAEHCGDPDRECPMQDISKPSGEHMQARDAARTALARAATAREGA